MYSLSTPIDTIEGIGPKLLEKFAEKGIHTFKDLLLFLPLRYSDRSNIVQIKDLEPNKLVSFSAKVSTVKSFYKNRRKIDSAAAIDATGKVKLMWFNNKFISQTVKPDSTYMISGKLNDRGTIVQPTIEKIADGAVDTIHTGRLVPIYSSTLAIQQGTLRRILKKALAKYQLSDRDSFFEISNDIAPNLPLIKEALTQLHFPDTEEQIIKARERLAIEELLSLIKVSEQIKTYWKQLENAQAINMQEPQIPHSVPFELTQAQKTCVNEILADIATTSPMNRVLIGDVGSGKTVVAGIAAYHTIQSGRAAAFIAPTKILAEQHAQTLRSIFPDLEIKLLTGKTPKIEDTNMQQAPCLFVGTHALINKLESIHPGLIIYDEQHRFGVTQRSESAKLHTVPHTLTMSATPIPRSLMLTIFSHLKVSTIDELPKGRIPTKTWVVPEAKRESAYDWIAKELTGEKLALIVCPFIDPSNHAAFENIASVKETLEAVKSKFSQLGKTYQKSFRIALLHGRMKPEEQNTIISQLYDKKIDVLVTTPVVEVGVDLPAASIMLIEAAERFGMASLHQLRGRVGRAGQQGYCLLFSTSNSPVVKQRLEQFSKENNGLKLAEIDLQARGSGDIFGVQQSGFGNLQFASWTNLELIGQAKKIYEKLPKSWEPFITPIVQEQDIKPLAN
ncbi:MAG: ATP-dependent DNA helicase RecG [Patescibacteria group bacterium]|nr:MAG: ATP-dependent DNA helicase RecG [Patescibacteria group bacterium]